jgi:plastocyanin
MAAGCGSTPSATPSSTSHQAVVTADDDFRFSPAHIELPRGRNTIVLRNAGAYPHNLSIPDLHVTSTTVSGSLGKQDTTMRLTVSRPGSYRFLCTYHDQAGMTGTLVVR